MPGKSTVEPKHSSLYRQGLLHANYTIHIRANPRPSQQPKSAPRYRSRPSALSRAGRPEGRSTSELIYLLDWQPSPRTAFHATLNGLRDRAAQLRLPEPWDTALTDDGALAWFDNGAAYELRLVADQITRLRFELNVLTDD